MTLSDDLVFGVCVLSEGGYVPLSRLDLDDIKTVQCLLDRNTTCPVKFTDALAFHRTALENAQHGTSPQTASAFR